ncbi:RNA methyltransferase [Eubacteriales bacterium mix99]|jgi:TrmH family RNA methyltransferase
MGDAKIVEGKSEKRFYKKGWKVFQMVPEVIRVWSKNNVYQHIEVLSRNREKRNKYGEFFVEGVNPISRLVENKWSIHSLIYMQDVRLSEWARNILKTAGAREHIELPAALMAELSDKEEPSELLAVADMPDNSLSRIRIHDHLLLVLFDRPSDYGNLGTIIRTCDSFRADGLILTGHCVDLYDPRTIRASVGSLFTLPVLRLPSHRELLPWLTGIRSALPGFHIVGSDEKADTDLADHDFTAPTALVLGNETSGMSQSYRSLCDSMVRISIHGSASSLNVACAASILLYEADRQRRRLSYHPGVTKKENSNEPQRY